MLTDHLYSAAAMADRLRVEFVVFHHEHKAAGRGVHMVLVGNVGGKVAGKTAVIIDDIVDTCTLTQASWILKEQGAARCVGMATHGLLNAPAVTVVEHGPIDRLVISNTLPLTSAARSCSKIVQMDVSYTFAEAIRRTHSEES